MVANWTDRRLVWLESAQQGRFFSHDHCWELGPVFTKGIVLRKLHLLGAARLEGAKKRLVSKAAKARALSRASKDGSALGMVKADRVKASPPVQPLKPAPICLVAPALPMASKPGLARHSPLRS